MKKIYTVCIGLLVVSVLVSPCMSLAEGGASANTSGGSAPAVTSSGLPNPLGQQNGTIYDFVKSVLAIFLKIGIFVAAVAFIYSGFLFVTAQGNSEKRTEASNAFFNTVLGTALLLGAWGLAQIIKATIDGIVG